MEIEHVFEEFRHGSEAPRGSGVGLGLSLSRRLVRVLGGDTTVSSEPGNGSEFMLWFQELA